MDLTSDTKDGVFNVRVAAVIIHNDELLTECIREDFYKCPGGGIQFAETAEKAVIRELEEKMGIGFKLLRPLYVCQDVFELQYEDCHEICFYFLVQAPDGIVNKRGFTSLDKKSNFVWIKFDQLKQKHFFPLFLTEEIKNLPKHLTLKNYLDFKGVK